MWIRLHKELRELALPWAGAVAAAVAVAALGRAEIALLVFAGLCFYLTVRPFGGEFDRGTLARLLSQPIPRQRIWREKILAATVAVLLGYGVMLPIRLEDAVAVVLGGAPGQPSFLPLWLILLVAIATGPTMSLVLRDSLRSFWAALALPAVVFLAATVVWSLLLGGPELPAVGAVLLPYCIVMTAWGYRRFLTLEVDTAAAPRRRRQTVAATGRGPARELLVKELRLQASSLLPVPVALAAFIPVWWYFRADPRLADGDTLGMVLFGVGFLAAAMLSLVVPALIGAHAVAWERQLGVLGWHLGLPVSRRLQWRLKLACCLLLTLAVGSTLGSAQFRFLFLLVEDGYRPPPHVLVLAPVAIMACSLYGSRLAKHPFSALGIGLISVLPVAYVWQLLYFTLLLAGSTWLVGLRPLFLPVGLAGMSLRPPSAPAELIDPASGFVFASSPRWLDLIVALTLLALMFATPRQENWLFGRRRLWPEAFAAILALSVAALSQIYVFNQISVQLDREIAAKDDELASAGGADLVAGSGSSPEVSYQQLCADLQPIYSYGIQVFHHDPAMHLEHLLQPVKSQMKFAALFGLRQPASPAMKFVAWFDGAFVGPAKLKRFEGERLIPWVSDFDRALWSRYPSPDLNEPLVNYDVVRTSRGWASWWRRYSLGPVWFREHRRQQFDRRVRQSLILDALNLLRYLERSPAVDRDHLQQLLDATPLAGMNLEPVDLAIAREIGDRQDEGAAPGKLGHAYFIRREPRPVIEYYQQSIVIAREIGHPLGIGFALGNLGSVYRILGQPRRAIEYYEQHLQIAREVGDRPGEGAALAGLGLAATDLEEPRRAIEVFEQALQVVRESGDRRGESATLGGLGKAYRILGQPRRAIEYHEQQLAITREIAEVTVDSGQGEFGDRVGEVAALAGLGLATKDLGEPRRAIQVLDQAIAMAREIGDRRGEAIASWNLGLVFAESGELERAVELMEVRVALEREIGHADAERHAAEVAEIRARFP